MEDQEREILTRRKVWLEDIISKLESESCDSDRKRSINAVALENNKTQLKVVTERLEG